MIFLQNWKFFSKKGNQLNLSRKQKISISIADSSGNGVEIQPITSPSGDLVFLEIINGGLGYSTPEITLLDELTQESHVIPAGDIIIDGDGIITAINLGTPNTNWSYPAFSLEGSIFIDEKIPTNLIETEHIFILEEVQDLIVSTQRNYVFPRYCNDLVAPCTSNQPKIEFSWTTKETDEADKDAFFIFDVDTTSELTPYIEKIDTLAADLLDGSVNDYNLTSTRLIRILGEENPRVIKSNIGFSYEEEGVFERTLEIYDASQETKYLIAEIKIHAETESEDPRFKTILDNLGQKINADEEFIFRDSDVSESLPNVKLLNEKRKEFILEHANIISYIGSYKGIFNALNWLGYNDLKLQEYWVNVNDQTINYLKYKPVDIPFDLARKGEDIVSSQLLPSNKYKKTNLFSLSYDINRESGEIDEFGIPITEDAFEFTDEEVLIKLFALKKYLKDKFLPLNARIIDINGQGVYFERYAISSWTDGTQILDISLTREADFTCLPKESTIIDLRSLEEYDYFQPAQITPVLTPTGQIGSLSLVDPGFGYVGTVTVKITGGAPSVPATASVVLNSLGGVDSVSIINPGSGYIYRPEIKIIPEATNPDKDSTIIQEIKSRLLGFFDGINDLSVLPDKASAPVGAPVFLDVTTFNDVIWDDITQPWNSFYYNYRQAEINLFVDGSGAISGFEIIDEGEGYVSAPTVTLQGGSPTVPGAITLTITAGSVTNVTINTPGSGYVAEPIVSLSGGVPVSALNTWDSIGFGDFYEIEWIIRGQNPLVYEYRRRGRVDDLAKHMVILPNTGVYDIELILYDTDNNWTNEIKKGCVTVKQPEITFVNFSRFLQGWQTWNDLDKITWDEATFEWLTPVRHKTTWDDLDLTWNELEMAYYTQNEFNKFTPLLTQDILRVSEYDRYLGQITEVDISINEITVVNAPVRPPNTPGDYIYLRQDETIIRKQIVSIDHKHFIDSVEVDTPGSYTININFGTGVINNARPIAVIDPPIGIGETATAKIRIDGTMSQPTYEDAGQGYLVAINSVGIEVPLVPLAGSGGGTNKLNIEFADPELNIGVPAVGIGNFDDTTGSFISWDSFTSESGYTMPPNAFVITDDNGNKVINSSYITPQNLTFEVEIVGPIEDCIVTNQGSGYTTIPTITITPGGGSGVLFAKLSSISDESVIVLNSLPIGFNTTWEILREIGQTILVEDDLVFTENNLQGIKIGDWLSIEGKDDIDKIEKIEIIESVFNSQDLLAGISLAGDYTGQFITGEKGKVYKFRSIEFGTGLGSDEFSVDTLTDIITINAPTFDPFEEIVAGYHMITLNNIDSSDPLNPTIFSQRFLVENIIENGSDTDLKLIAIDGDLSLFNNDALSTLEYKYWEFPTKVVSFSYDSVNTDVVLNFNDWPENKNFDDTSTWFFDYGTASGLYNAKVIDIGNEGTNTIVTVDDPNSYLWEVSTSFGLRWRVFNEKEANLRSSFKNFTWDSFDNITWDDMAFTTWDMLEYNQYNYCGFRINVVTVSGQIQWNEESIFEFTGITGGMTTTQKINQAVLELNETDNCGLTRFDYIAMPDAITPTYIQAVATTPGSENLGYIRFFNGTEGEYTADPTISHTFPINNANNPDWLSGSFGPDNNPANWDVAYRTYREYGVDPNADIGWYPADSLPNLYSSTQDLWKSERIPYKNAIDGVFTWSDLMCSPRNSMIPLYATVFFSASGCNIAGKSGYLWRIIDQDGNILIETISPNLIWTFNNEGKYDIELSITDTNGNVKTRRRKEFMEIVGVTALEYE